MVALTDLQPASFRGVRFLVPKDHAEEGPNVVPHSYPDSSNRYVEYNGYTPPDFHVTAVLHGPSLLADFNALKSALNRPAPGTLHHPYYGAQFCAVKGPWKVTREDKDSGVLHLDITFLVTSPPIFPGLLTTIAALVTGLSSSFIGSLFSQFSAAFGNPLLSLASMNAMSAALEGVASAFVAGVGAVSQVQIAAGHLITAPDRYIATGSALGPELARLFRGPLEDDTYDGTQIVTALVEVDAAAQRIASKAYAITPTTSDYIVRQSSLLTFSTFVRLACLSSMAEAMAGSTYTDADSVLAAQDLLLGLYADIPTDSLPSETGNEIARIVGAAIGVLRKLELQLPRIETLRVEDFPASVLAYQLYETDARTQTLVDLNITQNPVSFERDVNVLAGVN